VIKDAVEMASTLLDAKHHHLQLDLPARCPVVDGDSDRLAQIVSNLVTNAAKYTPTGGHITIAVRAVASDALITVTDDGVGIAADVLPHVFEPFVQANQARDHYLGGLGLGLAIVKNLVELHGGSIAIDSALGRGTHVTVRLPVATAVATVMAPAKRLERAHSGERLLVVDDNIDAANLLCEFLNDLGFETRAAHDGPSALAISKDYHPTLALLDIGLPVMDGYELGARLRRDHDQLRMIAITGYGDVADRRRSEQAGFEDHLVKPIDLARLVHTLRA
jgi:CheY-like chemotaxis protein